MLCNFIKCISLPYEPEILKTVSSIPLFMEKGQPDDDRAVLRRGKWLVDLGFIAEREIRHPGRSRRAWLFRRCHSCHPSKLLNELKELCHKTIRNV